MRESRSRLGRSGGGVRGLWSSYLRRRGGVSPFPLVPSERAQKLSNLKSVPLHDAGAGPCAVQRETRLKAASEHQLDHAGSLLLIEAVSRTFGIHSRRLSV